MKWTKQGRELAGTEEAIAKEYANKEIYIYGSGIIGERFFYAIQRLTDWTVKAFIDKYKAGDICQGLDVLSLEEFSRRANADCLVLIALHDDIGQEVKEGLSVFLENKRSICKTYNEFMRHDFPLLMLHQYQKVVVNSLSCIVM